MNQILEGSRVILLLGFLIFASWSDYKNREVSNKVWVILGPISLFLTGFQFLVYSPKPIQNLIFYVLSFGITSALAIVIFYVGGFGGADAKALMCIALALPVYPNNLLPRPLGFISPLFPITIFTNGVLLGSLSVFYALFRNIIWIAKHKKSIFDGLENESFGKKLLALFSGYKINLNKIKNGHMFPLEDIEVNDERMEKRKLLVFPDDEEKEEIISKLLRNLEKEKLDAGIWATPGLPLLIFITLGSIIALVYGDIVWILISSILG
ncbi:MAG: A24 family peptidase C-terminal domain-containing protein [Candidatus Bathyarchaeota archaeon]